jgi:RND family efflux transporter MFP subunit
MNTLHPQSAPVSAGKRAATVLKNLLTFTLGIAGLALFLAWMGGAFHHKVEPGEKPVEKASAQGRELVLVNAEQSVDAQNAVGTVQPRRRTEIASQILANIREIKHRPGDKVAAGELLVLLDDRELLAQQREALASQAAADADLVTRRGDLARARLLRGTAALSVDEFARIEGAFKVAEAQVKRVQETSARIEVQLSHTRINAPTAGIIGDRFAEPGDLAAPGKPLLTFYEPENLELHASVPESLATRLALGQSLLVRVDAGNYTTHAAIREIVPQADPTSRSVLVKLTLPKVGSTQLLPGMYGRVSIPVGQSERIWIPSHAVRNLGQLDLVEVVDADNRLTRRFVRLGREDRARVEVLSGLKPGERIALPAR